MLAIENNCVAYSRSDLFTSTNNITARKNINEVEAKSNLNLEKIESIYLDHFKEEFKNFEQRCTKSDLQVSLIRQCKAVFKNSKKLVVDNKTIFQVNFALDLNETDFKTYKKIFDKEIGFFNFKITAYKSTKLGEDFKISYFSEVSVDEKFQSYGLFGYISKAYTETLKELDIDVDYLHVKSKKDFTAKIYNGKGYTFTPDTEQLLSQYGGKEAYLADSSVSYGDNYNVEMFRTFNSSASVTTSIADLEKTLAQKKVIVNSKY